jgi:hypothetical protein
MTTLGQIPRAVEVSEELRTVVFDKIVLWAE